MNKYNERGKYGSQMTNLFAKRSPYPFYYELERSGFFEKKMNAFEAASKRFHDAEGVAFDFRREVRVSFIGAFPCVNFYV